jgi:hypothetical protein
MAMENGDATVNKMLSNNRFLTDAFGSPLRAAHRAAKPER